jgi:uncharacterized protein YheU (UPF0270 family)
MRKINNLLNNAYATGKIQEKGERYGSDKISLLEFKFKSVLNKRSRGEAKVAYAEFHAIIMAFQSIPKVFRVS